MRKTVEELSAFIAKNISYDGSEDAPAIICPHCGKEARQARHSYWIDHKGVLEYEIQQFLGFKTDAVRDVLEYANVTGSAKADAKDLAEQIISEVYL